jgi:hypothetical protein
MGAIGEPGWRNWQTRQTQNLVLAREWEFDPPSGHQGLEPKAIAQQRWGPADFRQPLRLFNLFLNEL